MKFEYQIPRQRIANILHAVQLARRIVDHSAAFNGLAERLDAP